MVGGCLKLGCILYLFVSKLLVSIRFWSELPVMFPVLYLLLFLCAFFIVFYCFFLASFVSAIIIILLFTLLYFSFCAFWIREGPALPTYLHFLL